MRRYLTPGLLLSLTLLLAALPARAAERSGLLLYGFATAAPATPPPIPGILAVLVRDELQKSGRYTVSIRTDDSPLFLRAESERPTDDPTQLHQALRTARSLGARYVVQGVITAYEPPSAKSEGKITVRLTVASAETEVSRDLFVTAEMKVSGRSATAAARVMAPAARAVATAIATEGIPNLERVSPGDRAQAAERARERGKEAAASGAPGAAVQDLQRAARLTPEDAPTHVALGDALVKQGKLASALLEFQQALALEDVAAADPREGTLRQRVIQLLGERDLWDEAAAEARRGLERTPDSESLRRALSEAEIQRGDGAAALAALQPLRARREPSAEEWRLLADAYALTGDAPRWLDATVRGAVLGVPEGGQYAVVIRRLDAVFHDLTDKAAEAERRVLAGQVSLSNFRATTARRAAQAQVVIAYLGRLAYPDADAAAHQARQDAWNALSKAAAEAGQFAESGRYESLGAARADRLRAVGLLERSPLQ